MSLPRERELKYLLRDQADYRRILECRDWGELGPLRRLENRYYDTRDGLLARADTMLRLRSHDGWLLTYKHGSESHGIAGFFDAIEIETAVPEEIIYRVSAHGPKELLRSGLAPAEEVLKRFGAVHLVEIGRLVTERQRIDSRYPLELDRVHLPDGSEFFELEVETEEPQAVEEWLSGRFQDLGVRAVPQSLTKLQMLLDRCEGEDGRSHRT